MGDVLTDQVNQAMDTENIPRKLGEAIGPVISSTQLSNEEKVEKVGHLVAGMIAVSQESFSGPMPHPDILKGYKELIPNAPTSYSLLQYDAFALVLPFAEYALEHWE